MDSSGSSTNASGRSTNIPTDADVPLCVNSRFDIFFYNR